MIKPLHKKKILSAVALTLSLGLLFASSHEASVRPIRAMAASAGESEEEKTEEDKGGEIFNKELGAVTFYRWERSGVSSSLNDWTMYMMIEEKNNDSYISAEVPDSLFFDRDLHPGRSFPRNDRDADSATDISSYRGGMFPSGKWNLLGYYDSNTNGVHYNIEVRDCDVVVLPDRAYKFTNKDKMIKTDRDVFFTDDDRNVPYVKYFGNDQYNVCFADDLQHHPDAKKYYLKICDIDEDEPGGEDDEDEDEANRGYLKICAEDEATEYDTALSVKGGVLCQSNSEYRTSLIVGMLHGAYVRYNWKKSYSHTSYKMYRGSEMHFSTLDGETVIPENMVFNVSEGNYVNAKKETMTTQGVMIQNGGKLKINGGVVSVKGTLINNGTIEITNGGVLIVQDGASISSFLPGKSVGSNGCGKIICNGGDIIIEKGGAIYGGMCTTTCEKVPFYLDNNSNLINCGLLMYGSLRLGSGSRVECRTGSKTIGGIYPSDSSLTTYDGDYDIPGNYTNKIMKASGSSIPSECKGLTGVGSQGMVKKSSSDKVTVLKYEGAVLSDSSATGAGLVSDYEGL